MICTFTGGVNIRTGKVYLIRKTYAKNSGSIHRVVMGVNATVYAGILPDMYYTYDLHVITCITSTPFRKCVYHHINILTRMQKSSSRFLEGIHAPSPFFTMHLY